MPSNKASGFSFVEAMISITIVGIISVIAFYNLRTSRMNDELRTAAHLVAADLRSAQTRALHGENVKWCPNPLNIWIVCEDSTAGCDDACVAYPSGGFGVHFDTGTSIYQLYSKYHNATSDWRMVTSSEVIVARDLAKSGAANVTISGLDGAISFTGVDAAFMRQTGQMRINACSTCSEQSYLKITLKHSLSLKTIVVSLNYNTGRISIEE